MATLVWTRGAALGTAVLATAVIAGCSLTTSLDGLTGGDGEATGADGGDVGDGPGSGTLYDAAGAGGGDGGDALAVRDSASSVAPDGAGGGDDSGSSGGTDSGAPSPDSGSPGGDAGGGSDAGGHDAGGPIDSGPIDSGRIDSGPSLTFCEALSPAPQFCNDFDRGAANPAWDQLTSTNGSAVVNGADSFSSPDSMVNTVSGGANPNNIDVAGYRSLTAEQGVKGTATLDFEMKIDAGDTSASSDAVLAAIQLWNGSAAWVVELEVSATSSSNFGVSLTENSPYVAHAASGTLAVGAWTRVTMAIALPPGSGGATTASLALNGVTALGSTQVHVLGGGSAITNPIPEAVVGPTYASSTSGGWSIRYDNVNFSVR